MGSASLLALRFCSFMETVEKFDRVSCAVCPGAQKKRLLPMLQQQSSYTKCAATFTLLTVARFFTVLFNAFRLVRHWVLVISATQT
ncbi:hypothetical protein TSMEX_006515 [Taenia solium]|eukprot:TsM_000315200 transcript=TsM_000315200 gene=TsM_000315200